MNNDSIIWTKFKKGDYAIFSHIYQQYVQLLYGYGKQVTSDTDLIEDSIQDLFIYLWEKREHLGDTQHIKYYLYKSLRRLLVAKLNAHQKQLSSQYEHLYIQEDKTASFEQFLIENEIDDETCQNLKQAVQNLTKRQREAIYLRFYENLSFKEVSEVMALNLKSTYNLISKALEMLRKNLSVPLLLAYLKLLSES